MTSQSPVTKRYVPTHSTIHIACIVHTSQSVNQAKQISIVPYVASESDARLHRDHPPPTYRMQRLLL